MSAESQIDPWIYVLRSLTDSGCGLMAFIRCFLDEGSTHESAPLTCVGGYLFDPESATVFQSEWNEILKPFASRGIVYFHATDCAFPDGEFTNLFEEERKYLFRELVALTRKHARFGFVAELEAALLKEWRAANPTISAWCGSRYAICCLQCLMFIKGWAEREHYEGQIAYEFEAQRDKNKGKGNPFENEVRKLMGKISSSPKLSANYMYAQDSYNAKGTLRPHEAADLLAWTYPKLDRQNATDFVKIGKGLFREGSLPHQCTMVTHAALSFQAVFNSEHGLRP